MKKKISIKKLLDESKLDGIMESHLSKDDMKKLYGGNVAAPLASATQTSSGDLCDGTAVCNCRPCPTNNN